MTNLLGRDAIVVGAGIGGLTAAKALSSYFGSVTVLERDALPPAPIVRTGTPQARQIHVLLRGGLDALIEFFPEFETELERAGAVRVYVELSFEQDCAAAASDGGFIGQDPYEPGDRGLWAKSRCQKL